MEEQPNEAPAAHRQFIASVFPTIDPAAEDRWERSLSSIAPRFVRATTLHPGQDFDLLVFFIGYGVSHQMYAEVSYDWALRDAAGKVLQEGKGLEAIKGRVLSGDMVMRPAKVERVTLPRDIPTGTYTLEVSAACAVSGQTSSSRLSVEVRAWALTREFQDVDAVMAWIETYLDAPQPERMPDAYLCLFDALAGSAPDQFFVGLAFCAEVLRTNAWLGDTIEQFYQWDPVPPRGRRAFGLLYHAARHHSIQEEIARMALERAKSPFPSAADLHKRPPLHPQELDLLWAIFRASGHFQTFKHLLKAAGPLPEAYQVTLDEHEQEALMQAAAWSIDQHLSRHPLGLVYAMATYRLADLHPRVYLLIEGLLRRFNMVKNEDYLED
jgi:hypothetical protein